MTSINDLNKNLPTYYSAPRKPSFITDILNNNDFKKALMKHRKQADLKRNETEKFRNSFKKQLCIQMLSKGFHKSFAEILDIIQLQYAHRLDLGNEHPVWNRPILIQEPTKFEILCTNLNIAEEAERGGDIKVVYSAYHDLANYFSEHDEQWLSDFFFNKCLLLVNNGKSDWEIRKEAESNCDLGLSFEKQTNDFTAKSERIKDLYFKSMKHYEKYYALTKNQNWHEDVSNETKSTNDTKLFTKACIHLQRVYRMIAEKYCNDNLIKIEYLIKALDVCREGTLKAFEGQISYILGKAYEEIDSFDTALVCFNNFYEISKKMNDIDAFGKSSEALANCYKKMGNLDKSIEYLKKYLGEVTNSLVNDQYGSICSSLASIYNALGKYEIAAEFSKTAFEISNQKNNRSSSEINRVIFATAKAHKELSKCNSLIEKNTKETMKQLIISKSNSLGYIIHNQK